MSGGDDRGFTLTEILMASAVLGLVLTLTAGILKSLTDARIRESRQKAIAEAAAKLYRGVGPDLLSSMGITELLPAPFAPVRATEPAFPPGAVVLVHRVHSITVEGMPSLEESDTITLVFDPSSGRLSRQCDPDVDSSRKKIREVLAEGVQSLSWEADPSLASLGAQPGVGLIFVLRQGNIEKKFRSYFGFRNHAHE